MVKSAASPDGVRSVNRSLLILTALADERSGLGVGELASRINLPQATTHRLLLTLVGNDWVSQDPSSGRYELGIGILGVGAVAHANSALLREAKPILTEIAENSGFHTLLSVRLGRRVAYLASALGPTSPKYEFLVGVSMPAHATADGKVLLAYRTKEERDQLFGDVSEFRAYTPNTITTREGLEEVLAIVRRCNYALDLGERFPDWYGAAVPVFGPSGNPIAAILSGTRSPRPSQQDTEKLAREMKPLANELSRRLGMPYD